MTDIVGEDGGMGAIRDTLLAVVGAVRDYLPPDGIGKDEFISRVIEAVDSPAIVPIIKEWEE